MGYRFRCSCQLLVLAVLALLAAGCNNGLGPNASAAPPTISPDEAFVSASQGTVQLLRSGSSPRDLQPGDNVALQAQDQVNVEGKSRAFLEFPHQVEVEMERSSQMALADLRLEPAGPISVTLKQLGGHSFTRLESRQRVRMTIATDYATTTPLADDTQFLVCHVPGTLTCVVVVNGQAQVAAAGQSVNLKTGEGTYVTPRQPPHTPFCADVNQVRDWWSKMRGTDDTGDLGSMMVGWLQNPCPTPGAAGRAAAGPPQSPAPTLAAAGATQAPAADAATAVPAAPRPTATPAPSPTSQPSPTRAATIPVASPTLAPSATLPPASPTATAASTATPAPYSSARLPSKDGMVKIPAGDYTVGSSTPDDNHIAGHAVKVAQFWIDKFEVTNAQYKVFVDATKRAVPASWRDGAIPAGHAAHPVVGLTWDDAAAYCTWANKRLPTEAEWEAAGRGPGADPPLYPWGNDPTASGQTFDLPQRDTYEVGTVAFNHSSLGVYDLIGSVWQWVDEPYAPVSADSKVLRGGRYGLFADLAYRQQAKPDDQRFTRVAGVRCAADHVENEG